MNYPSDIDRILRSSVPDEFKGAKSPIGAIQGYISQLEYALENLGYESGSEKYAEIVFDFDVNCYN